jgi:hypothetical protein
MSRGPDFDELVDDEVDPRERDRLRRTHELLVTAGPPPELTPEMEAGPTLGMTLGRRSTRHMQRRIALLAAALVLLSLVFLGGFITGNDSDGGGIGAAHVLKLRGTSLAPDALASLSIEPADPAGNWPMRLSVVGLPKLPPRGYYEVFVTRHGKIFAPCGIFVVRDAKTGATVPLNAPYKLEEGDGWVVTRQNPGQHTPGRIVMRPLT